MNRPAHHQAGPLRCRDGQPRSPSRRLAQSRVLAELQRLAGRSDLSRRGTLRTNLDRRNRSLRHGEHEGHAQRRSDDRHARRSQYRNPRRGRRREHLHLRHDGRASRTSHRGAVRSWELTTSTPASRAGHRHDRREASSTSGNRYGLPTAVELGCSVRATASWCWPILPIISPVKNASRTPAQPDPRQRPKKFDHQRGPLGAILKRSNRAGLRP